MAGILTDQLLEHTNVWLNLHEFGIRLRVGEVLRVQGPPMPRRSLPVVYNNNSQLGTDAG
jgi:hypothetical protein